MTSLERLLEYSQLPDEISKNKDEKVKFNRDRAKANLKRILDARRQSYEPFVTGNIRLQDFTYAYANNVPILRPDFQFFKEIVFGFFIFLSTKKSSFFKFMMRKNLIWSLLAVTSTLSFGQAKR